MQPFPLFLTSPILATNKMARVVVVLMLLAALCVLPALVTAGRPFCKPFYIRGRVYCDSCRCGYEIPGFTTPVANATITIECRESKKFQLSYSIVGKTDDKGNYEIKVDDDHEDQICDVVLVSSPQANCASADPGRNRSRVPITRYNGLVPDIRFANAMGFLRDQPLSGCSKILKQYMEYE